MKLWVNHLRNIQKPTHFMDHNSTKKPEARLSENCQIYGGNGWVDEVEIQDGMRLWLIRIQAGFKNTTYAAQNTQINRVVYSHLSVATLGGTAHHLIKKHDNNKNGYGAWNALFEWYNGYYVNNKAVDFFKYKF